MISWLVVIILSYFFFALSGFGDKIVLSGPPNPKSYTFFIGLLSIVAVLAIPFVNFQIPQSFLFFWIALDAIVFAVAMYFAFWALEHFEVSKVAVTIGAAQPIFILFISWIFFGPQKLSVLFFVAFLFLFFGGVLVSYEKKINFSIKYFTLTIISSLMFSLDYVISKLIYNNISFASGFIWRSIFLFFVVMLFLIFPKARKEIFTNQGSIATRKKFGKIFLATQTCGGTANVLQGFAISLAPVAFLPIVNSLRGLQYVFLFLITTSVSYFFPKVLKEKISKKIIAIKIISIILITIGLAVIVF